MILSEVSVKKHTDTRGNIQLMGNKLNELGTALFSASGTHLWKFPVALIWNAKADEAGNIWFVLRNVVMEDELTDAHFFAQLQFYNKELQYYLRVDGDAKVISPGMEIPERFKRIAEGLHSNEFLIKLRVCQANFYTRKKKEMRSIL